MAKIIKFNDIQLKSVELYENEDKVFAHTHYALKDEEGKLWEDKAFILKDADFSKTEIKEIQNILKSAYHKIKSLEKI